MPLIPSRVKRRKPHTRGYRLDHTATRCNTLAFGDYGIQALEPAYVTNRQIEAARRSITNYLKRGGKVWIRIFPDKPFTKRGAESRMGKGKGDPDHFIFEVLPGRVLFEMEGVTEVEARQAMRLG